VSHCCCVSHLLLFKMLALLYAIINPTELPGLHCCAGNMGDPADLASPARLYLAAKDGDLDGVAACLGAGADPNGMWYDAE